MKSADCRLRRQRREFRPPAFRQLLVLQGRNAFIEQRFRDSPRSGGAKRTYRIVDIHRRKHCAPPERELWDLQLVYKHSAPPEPAWFFMYCPTCGSDNQSNVRFCRRCGTSLEAVSLALSRQGEDRPLEKSQLAQLVKN